MTIDDAWLDRANPADLESLAQSLIEGRVGDRFSVGAIQLAGFGDDAARFLDGFRGTDPRVVAWILQRLARERRRADDRYAGVAQLVWSGTSEGKQAIRDTKVVLDGLFARAESHSETGLAEDEGTEVAGFMAHFARKHWPSEVSLPAVYYDPETRKLGAKRASLHAKCVVVDRRWAFVTSANFTEAAQERNIEAGVLLDHPRIAASLAARFEALRDSGLVRRMR